MDLFSYLLGKKAGLDTSNFITSTDVKSIVVVSELPAEEEPNVLYLVYEEE